MSQPSARDFLIDDYKEKVQYLGEQFTRMWNRFNFLLTLEAGIFAVFVGTRSINQPWIALLGVVVSAIWFVFGAQDRYLVVLYREEIKSTLRKLAEIDPHLPLSDYYYTGQTENVSDNSQLGKIERCRWPR